MLRRILLTIGILNSTLANATTATIVGAEQVMQIYAYIRSGAREALKTRAPQNNAAATSAEH